MSGPAPASARLVAPAAPPRAFPSSRPRRAGPRAPRTRARVIPPNKEWPPADVWEDFRKNVAGEWTGHAVALGPTGDIVPLPDEYVPSAFKEYGVGVNQWSTRATTAYDGDGGIDAVDSFSTTTRYLWPEAGCEFGKEDVAVTRGGDDRLMAGAQMGKMCVVDGDYAHGPLVLPPCEHGSRVKFQFGFSQRTRPVDETSSNGPIKLTLDKKDTKKGDREPDPAKPASLSPLPARRIRVEVTVEAKPGEKRDWRLAEVELVSEARADANGTVLGSNPRAPEHSPRLGEDDIATGEWRAVQGATFLTCESLLDDEAFDLSFDDEPSRLSSQSSNDTSTSDGFDGQSSDDTSTSDDERMRVRVGSGKGRAGRGRVKKDKGGEKVGEEKGGGEDSRELVTPTVVKSAAELEAERKERRRNRPPPQGLIVVPTWAVSAKGPFSSAYEYLVGGKSPLVLLPMRMWCLVESVGRDELLVEVGVYAGPGGLDEDWHDLALTEGGGSEPRRVAARRYERGGRFASAFFVEESRMTKAELEQEKGEGEGGNPLYF